MTHPEIIDLWPSIEAFADDVGAKVATARKWRQRGRIPSEYWVKTEQAASERKIVNVTLLAIATEVAA